MSDGLSAGAGQSSIGWGGRLHGGGGLGALLAKPGVGGMCAWGSPEVWTRILDKDHRPQQGPSPEEALAVSGEGLGLITENLKSRVEGFGLNPRFTA